ncbi:MAG TPA: FAD-dependent oxidoreductase, partial [Candidatus Binatia bacterium]|nr:FAD-dependent oxidoreductase [Candidatus Binatia bacterium]
VRADPDGMYLTPDEGARSVRTAPYADGQRLLIVGGEEFRPGTVSTAEHFVRLEQWTRDRFAVDRFAYQWAARDYGTTDGVPYVGELPGGDGRAWVATGFGAWGMTNGVLTGRLLASAVTGQRSEWADLYDPRRLHPLAETASLIKRAPRSRSTSWPTGTQRRQAASRRSNQDTGEWYASTASSARCTGTTRAYLTRCPRRAPTSAAWWASTTRNVRGTARGLRNIGTKTGAKDLSVLVGG